MSTKQIDVSSTINVLQKSTVPNLGAFGRTRRTCMNLPLMVSAARARWCMNKIEVHEMIAMKGVWHRRILVETSQLRLTYVYNMLCCVLLGSHTVSVVASVVCLSFVCLSRVRSRKLSEIGAKFRRLSSDFAPEVAIPQN